MVYPDYVMSQAIRGITRSVTNLLWLAFVVAIYIGLFYVAKVFMDAFVMTSGIYVYLVLGGV